MADEQDTSGTTVNPAADSHAPRQSGPVMDVTPPASTTAEPPVVEAPPEDVIPAVSDELAEQMAADATVPPVSAPVAEPAPAAPVDAPSPETPEAPKADAEASEPKPEDKPDQPAPAPVAAPKPHNPASTAITIVVIITIALACLAVFAFLSTQK